MCYQECDLTLKDWHLYVWYAQEVFVHGTAHLVQVSWSFGYILSQKTVFLTQLTLCDRIYLLVSFFVVVVLGWGGGAALGYTSVTL